MSEQFLEGTSAQYRLCSAVLLKLEKFESGEGNGEEECKRARK